MELMNRLDNCSVDLIYCDILYGTGRKFADYQDLKAIRSVIEEHYVPRIKEMHRVLKDTGSIYLQMDTRINHWIRIILDDVFGYDCFRNEIVACISKGKQKNGHIISMKFAKKIKRNTVINIKTKKDFIDGILKKQKTIKCTINLKT